MRNTVLTLAGLLLATVPVSLFGDVVTLNGIKLGDTTVTILEGAGGNTVSVGNCVNSVCTLAGQGSVLGFTFPWSITSSPVPFAFISPALGILQPGSSAGVFRADDSSDGGGDDVQGTVTLSAFTQSGTSATVFGTATALGGGINFNHPADLAAFDALLVAAGFSINTTLFPGLPTPEGTVNLTISISNCMSGGKPSACFPDPIPETITGTISSVALTSAVPEPGNLIFLSCGMAGLALVRRLRKRS